MKTLFNKIKNFVEKYWMIIINYLIIFISYTLIYDKGVFLAEILLGLWLFVSASYGLYKLLIK